MFNLIDDTKFPFESVKKIQFAGKKIIITFLSGNVIQATRPNKKTQNEFLDESRKHLKEEQIEIVEKL
jgi:hypothetical protein